MVPTSNVSKLFTAIDEKKSFTSGPVKFVCEFDSPVCM